MGKIPILTNIFQMGWNHQPEMVCMQEFFLCGPTVHGGSTA